MTSPHPPDPGPGGAAAGEPDFQSAAFETALIAAAGTKAGLLWLSADASPRPRPAWYAWRDGAAYVVHEGIEQALPWLDESVAVQVVVPSKDKGGRVVTWVARPVPVAAGSPEWDAVVGDLHAARLNPPDGEAQPQRWARESRITRLEPTGEVLEAPGSMTAGSHSAEPPDTPATTRPPLPYVWGRRARRRSR